MKSQEIRKGDQLSQDGRVIYTVLADAEIDGNDVTVQVRWDPSQGGGRDIRVWDVDQDVPLTRPDTN